VKATLKGKMFQGAENIEKNVTAEQKAVIWMPLPPVSKNFLNYSTHAFK
jgi:hypothetical protein